MKVGLILVLEIEWATLMLLGTVTMKQLQYNRA